MVLFNVKFHNAGYFVRGKFMYYIGGNETVVQGQDPDMRSYFETVILVKDWGYVGFRMWRKISGVDEGYFHFIDDKEALEISTHCLANNMDGHI